MGSRVIFSDLELFLTDFIRDELAALAGNPYPEVFVSNRFFEPDEDDPQPEPPFQVIVRDDGGPDTSIITNQPSVGITVLGGDDPTQGKEATDLALVVKAIVKDSARVEPGNPVAAVLAATGPYKVTEESGRPRRYMTFELSVTGSPFP